MSEELIYHVKGSTPDPYIVSISLSPLSISCTCQAAYNGLPCKHRILILQGADPGILEGDKSKLEIINKTAESSDVFALLKDYDEIKAERKVIDAEMEKAFKKYRDTRLQLLQKKVKTDRAVIKARDAMDAAIEAIIPVEDKKQMILETIREIMIFPWE